MLEANQVGFLPTSERHKLYAVIVKGLVKCTRVIVGPLWLYPGKIHGFEIFQLFPDVYIYCPCGQPPQTLITFCMVLRR